MQYAIENGIINIAYVQDQIKMKKRQDILDKHNYKIWESSDGRWATKVKKEDGKLKLVKKSSKEKLEEFLISYYKEKPLSVSDVYQKAIQKKVEYKEISAGSVERYQQDFNRYFISIKDSPIESITSNIIEDTVKKNIANLDLSSKAFSNMRTIFYIIFKYAKSHGLTDIDILETFNYMSISKRQFHNRMKQADEQIFIKNERDKVIEYLMDNMDLINLGLLLAFKTGIRVGELAALKRDDIHEDYITINKTEIRYKIDGKYYYEIKDSAKTEAGTRIVYVNDASRWLLRRIRLNNCFGEYLFEVNGERIKTYQFRNRLRTICEKLKIKQKSPHKIRKTYLTMLLDSRDVTESTVTSQAGHTNISCTKDHYYYDDSAKQQKIKQLNSVSGL